MPKNEILEQRLQRRLDNVLIKAPNRKRFPLDTVMKLHLLLAKNQGLNPNFDKVLNFIRIGENGLQRSYVREELKSIIGFVISSNFPLGTLKLKKSEGTNRYYHPGFSNAEDNEYFLGDWLPIFQAAIEWAYYHRPR